MDPAHYPEPQIRTFTGPAGREVHAHIYPPHHPDHVAPGDELPPYVVWAHGGPTGRAPLVLDLEIAYFTSRGIGVAEVDYGGSAGHGREYRNRLREQWGVVDVEDCAAVALALAEEGAADRHRLAIRGGSAGGRSRRRLPDQHRRLRLWHDPVSGPRPRRMEFGGDPRLRVAVPGDADRADRRGAGPLRGTLAHRARRPHRRALPPPPGPGRRHLSARAVRTVLDRLARSTGRRVPHAYLTFEGEGHGFRRADTMVRALEAELSLYAPRSSACVRPASPPCTSPPRKSPSRRRRDPSHRSWSPPSESPDPSRPSRPGGPRRRRRSQRARGRGRLAAGLDILRGWDLDPVVAPHVLDRHPEFTYLAGTDADRAADFQAAWCDPDVAAVLCARGGYGVQRVVDLLDWDAIRAAGPKVLLGFSDITALHEAFANRAGLATLHGPMVAAVNFIKNARAQEHLRATLSEPETGAGVIGSGGDAARLCPASPRVSCSADA